MSFVADVGQSRKTKMGECQENQLCVLTVWASGRLVLQSEDRFAKRSASRYGTFSKKQSGPHGSERLLCLQKGRAFTSPI
jgi:hypothetical protein